MSQRSNKPASQKPANGPASFWVFLAQSRALIILFGVLASLIVIVLVWMVVRAFNEGRSISFWPPSIGAVPTVATQPTTPTILSATAGTSTSSLSDDASSLDSLPFIAFTWTYAEVQSEKGWATLNIINDTNFQKKYQIQYTLPMSSTKYSGVGLTFKFSNPQNLAEYNPQDFTKYNYVSINIAFNSTDTRCDLILYDISDKAQSVALSPNIDLNPDIERRRNGLTETFTIPLDTYSIPARAINYDILN